CFWTEQLLLSFNCIQPWKAQCFYPDFPHDVVCGDSWGDNRLILAAEAGAFLLEEGVIHRPIFDRTVQIKQVNVVEEHGILIFRADKGKDSRIYVFSLSDFDSETRESGGVRNKSDLRDHRLEKTKGCHLYAISRPCDSHLRMVVAFGRRLLVFQWRHTAAWCASLDTDTVDGFQFIRELPVSEPVQLITLVDSPIKDADNQICVAYKHQFDLVNEKNGDTLTLHFC
ncbi:GTPase-activating Rap/Ran-GAP domain-like protein 3, partial [Limulus polyphemus]|uniref:GTPase-activating Rap/Ran-GAP domain-like protein 3 n=1 Tax=Limulus polyphemus TaxID=6850 RepID=A0ABM1TJD4_LIMPO